MVADAPKVNILHLLAGSDSVVALNTVQKLLQTGEHDVSEQECEGITALHVAAAWDNLAMCQLLMHFGADPMVEDEHGRTPVSIANGSSRKFFDRVLDFPSENGRNIRHRRIWSHLFCCMSTPPSNDCRNLQKIRHSWNGNDRLLPRQTHKFQYDSLCNGNVEPAEQEVSSSKVHVAGRSTPKSFTVEEADESTAYETASENATILSNTSDEKFRNKSAYDGIDLLARGMTSSEIRQEIVDSWVSDDSSFSIVSTYNSEENNIPEIILEEVKGMSDYQLKNELISRGEIVGPLSPSTRCAYEKKLARIVAKLTPHKAEQRRYSYALERVLSGENCMEGEKLDEVLSSDFFCTYGTEWREGNQSTSFCYVLIDPSLIASSKDCCFKDFLNAIFYIGKGKRSRPFQHLIDARKVKGATNQKDCSPKLSRILKLWSKGYGVVSLHVFQNTLPVEAFTREAAMIDSYGLNNLTNVKRGYYYGVSKEWTFRQKTVYGSYLLMKCLAIFHVEGCRQLFQSDVMDA